MKHPNTQNLITALTTSGLTVELLNPELGPDAGFMCTRENSAAQIVVTGYSPYDFDDTPQTVRDILTDLEMAGG